MAKVVLDTTVLVSAFLNPIPGGAAYELLRFAKEGAIELHVSDDILEELAGVLLRGGRNRRRFKYSDEDALEYCQIVARLSTAVANPPEIRVVRDPNDDMILACAIGARADYVVSRDKDLLSLKEHEDIKIVAPEEFLRILRGV